MKGGATLFNVALACVLTVPTIFLAPLVEGIPPAGLRRFKANGRLYLERGLAAAEAALPRLEASFPLLRP